MFLLLGLAALLYLSSVMYGLPQELDADERLFFNSAVDLLQNKTLDPAWYGPPAQPLIYLLAMIIAGIAVIGTLLGQFGSIADVGPYFLNDVSLFYASGRVLNVVFALACVWLTDRLIRQVGIKGHWRWIALGMLCLSPLWGRYASIVRMDMMQVFFMLAALLFSSEAVQRITPVRNLVLAGACVGIAVTSKFPGIVSAVPVVVCAGLLLKDKVWTVRKSFTVLMLSGIASIVTAFLTGPYLFLNFSGMLNDVLFEARGTHLGHTGAGFPEQIVFYMTSALPEAISIISVIVGLVGLITVLPRSNAGKLVSILALIYLVFISCLSLQWARWTLPLLPLLAIGIAAGGDTIESLVKRKFADPRSGALFTGACILLFVPILATQTFPAAMARATNSNTRVQALAWVEREVPAGTRILTETYAPALRTDMYDLYVPGNEGGFQHWSDRSKRVRPSGYYGRLHEGWNGDLEGFRSALADLDIEYVMLSDSFYNRYKADETEGPSVLPFYEAVFEDYDVIKEFDSSLFTLGQNVFILKRKEGA
nr:glycosyltransferase family 39 protein [uncultured Hyphomonas sp.]